MTVTAISPLQLFVYEGPGDYDFNFLLYDTSDLDVVHIDDEGVITALDVGDYDVVTLQPDNGGTVTVTSSAYSQPGQLQIKRSVPYDQPIVWENEGDLDMNLIERSQDEIVMMIQQLSAEITDSIASVIWRGSWAPDTPYNVRDLVAAPDGNWYSAIISHTSGTDFDTDLAAGYWVLFLDLSEIYDAAQRAEDAADESEQYAAQASNSADAASSSASAASSSAVQAANSEGNAAVSAQQAANCADEAYSAVAEVLNYGGIPKNKLINGTLRVDQRNAFNETNDYVADQWLFNTRGDSSTCSRARTYLTGPLENYLPYYQLQVTVGGDGTANSYTTLTQPIKDVSTLAGQEVVVSFWLKGVPGMSVGVSLEQAYDTLISVTRIDGTVVGPISSSYEKFTATFTVPVLSTSSYGPGDSLAVRFWFSSGSDFDTLSGGVGVQIGTIEIAQIQLELGDTATPFEVPNHSNELLACQATFFTSYVEGIATQVTATEVRLNQITFPTTFAASASVNEKHTLIFEGYTGTPGALTTTGSPATAVGLTYSWTGGTPGQSFAVTDGTVEFDARIFVHELL